MKNVVVIGGGPAGIMAALAAADAGARVQLWERNDRLGRKLAITGKGRCNITNDSTVADLVQNLPGNGQFLYSALTNFDAESTMAFFSERCGLPLKVERGRRVFPASDQAHDVVTALKQQLDTAGVQVCYRRRAKQLRIEDGRISGLIDEAGVTQRADAVVIASGGLSYPMTGSTGDGYLLAEQAGHSIIPPLPSLVPLETEEAWPKELQGLSLRNVELKLLAGERLLATAFGEMLFAHFGVTGPLVLSLSHQVCARPQAGKGLRLLLDLKPALSPEQLDLRLQRDLLKFSRKHFANSLAELLPASMIPVFVRLSRIPEEKLCNQLTKEERLRIGALMKALPMTIKGPRPITEAIVTAGGVCIREVDPKTMASKKIAGLFFAGEVLDVYGFTGGYNLQAAWASGFCAGKSAAAK